MSKPKRIARLNARPSGSRAVAFGSPGVPGSGAPAVGRIARPVALLALAVTMLLALLAAPAAQAHESHAIKATYDFGGDFGTAGPGAMAIHQATHTLYVVDSTKNRILKFDISDPDHPKPADFSASKTNEITEADGAPLELAAGSNIAVDNSGGPQDGTIYLATNTAANSRAEAFSAGGAWIYQFGHNAEGKFDANGTPDLGKAIAVAQKGPRAGEIYRFGSNRNDSAAYTPSAVAGGMPTLRATGGPTAAYGTIQGAFYWSDGSELVLETYLLFGGVSMTPMNSATLIDSGSNAKYPTPSGTSDVTPAAAYRHLFVRRTGSLGLIEETGTGNITTAPPRILDEFAFGSPGTGAGMVYEAATNHLYVSDAASGAIDIYGAATAPDAEMLETGYVDPTHAMLRAAVDPHGATITECNFEWSQGTFFFGTYANTVSCEAMPTGKGEVTAKIPVVAPQTYHSRVVVLASNGTGASTPDFEWKAPNLPEAVTLPAGPQASSGAVLGGTVDANQTPAHFHIEYSTRADLSDSQSSEEADAGEGDSPTRVSQVVEGLEPDTTYYFRLVAVTKAGSDPGGIESFHTFEAPASPEPTTCPNAQFRTGPSAQLPECRAWERVSPADKNGQSVMQGYTVTSPDGNRVSFASLGAFAGQEERGFGVDAMYLADRSSSGWVARGISPGTTIPNSDPAYSLNYNWMTPDLSRLMGTGLNVNLPGAPDDNTAAYIWDEGSQQILPIALGAGKGRNGEIYNESGAGISDSGRSGIVSGPSLAVESGPNVASGEGGVYWWAEGTGLRLASTMPDGEPATGVGRGVSSISSNIGLAVLSRDGEKAVWQARGPAGRPGSVELYVSRRHGPTLWASKAQGVSEPPANALGLVAWTPDLRYLYFTANTALTENATAPGGAVRDLYRYDTEEEELVDLTTSDPAGGGVQTVVNVADDGSHVYFVATGNLAPGATGSEPKLYGWSEEGTRFITGLHPFTYGGLGQFIGNVYERTSRVSDGGRYFLFAFGGSVAGTRMDTVYDTGGHQMLYRYDWKQDRIDCVSCDPRGRPATSDAYLTMPARFRPGSSGQIGVPTERYFMSDAGRVMFTTAQSLSAGDVNSAPDTYLWDDGKTRLLTSGHSEYGEWAEAATKNFTNVFLLSGRQLVPADEDHDVDLYDARVDGGLASQQVRAQAPGPSCEAAACQGLGTSTPPAPRLDTERSGGEAAPAHAGKTCEGKRATVKRRGKAVRRHRSAVRRAQRAVRKAKRRYKAAPSARVHRQVVKQQRRLRRERAKVKRLRKQERRAKAALRRCQGGGSAKGTAQTGQRSGHRHARLLRGEGGRS